MDKLKSQLERKLIANVIIDKCKNADGIIINESLCTQERIIRFTTTLLRSLFPCAHGDGFDKSGEIALYELKNETQGLSVVCAAYEPKSLKNYEPNAKFEVLREFGESCAYNKPEDAFLWFDKVVSEIIPSFEKRMISDIVSTAQQDVLTEGTARSIISTRYERNRRARAICLAYHGKTCKACGVNFERDYGKEFSEIIEVHHIIPISEIGESYVVDPINDLMPLCPNCHAIVHLRTRL